MFKFKKIFIFAIIFIYILTIFNECTVKAITENSVVKPAFMDLGYVTKELSTFNAEVYNLGDSTELIGKVEGKGQEAVSIYPEKIALGKDESKPINVSIDTTKLNVGSYDLTISFIPKTSDKGWISSNTTSALRVKFVKPGVSIASFNAFDVIKPNVGEFHAILANFTEKESKVKTSVTIIDCKNNKDIYKFDENLLMYPYPKEAFYGTMKMNLETKDMDMGKYIARLEAVGEDGEILKLDKGFMVGFMKGKLEKVDVIQSKIKKKVVITADVKNIGNLNLPTSFKVSIKNDEGKEVFKDNVDTVISPDKQESFKIEWNYKYVPKGKYSIDYTVNMDKEAINSKRYIIIGCYLIWFIIIVVCIIIALSIFYKKKIVKKN